jgi:hypothetical protein
MPATGIAGSFMDPGVECGGASTGIGFGTNAIYDLPEQSPSQSFVGKAIGIRRIGFYDDTVVLTKPGAPDDLFVTMTAEDDVAPGESLGARPLNGLPVINMTGMTVKAGQTAIGISTTPAEAPPEEV